MGSRPSSPKPDPNRLTVTPAHRIATLAVSYGGAAIEPFNTSGELLTSVAVLDENNERLLIPIDALRHPRSNAQHLQSLEYSRTRVAPSHRLGGSDVQLLPARDQA